MSMFKLDSIRGFDLPLGRDADPPFPVKNKSLYPEVQPPSNPPLQEQVEEEGACSKCVATFNDPQWTGFVVDLFGISSQTCLLTGTVASEFVPFLSMASAPFYLYHASKDVYARFGLMVGAVKTARVADFFFWLFRGLAAVGRALTGIAKPFIGTIALLGFSQVPAISLTFSIIIPSILIACSAMGGISQGWSLARSIHAFSEFKRRKGSPELLEELLSALKGPTPLDGSEDELKVAEHELDEKLFQESHFTSQERRETLRERIVAFEKGQRTYTQQRAEAEKWEIIDTAESELHRKLADLGPNVLMDMLTFAAAILLLCFPAHMLPAYIIYLGSSIFGALKIILDKSISQEDFLRLERFLNLLESRENPAVDMD